MENNFRQDVINDIKWEKENIDKQVELLEPMAKSLRQSAGVRILSSGSYLLFQLICWVLAIGALLWLVFLYRMPPFFKLSEMIFQSKQSGNFAQHEIDLVEWTLRGMIILIAILFMILATQLGKLRVKSGVVNTAGKTLADMQLKLKERKDTLIAFEQKHNHLLYNDYTIEPDGFVNPKIDYNDNEDIPLL